MFYRERWSFLCQISTDILLPSGQKSVTLGRIQCQCNVKGLLQIGYDSHITILIVNRINHVRKNERTSLSDIDRD